MVAALIGSLLLTQASRGVPLAASEEFSQNTRTSVENDGFSSFSESSTSTRSRWTVSGLAPFDRAEFEALGGKAVVGIESGPVRLETTMGDQRGFQPGQSSFRVRFEVPLTGSAGFKYLTRPGDPPPFTPAPGAKKLVATAELTWKPGGLSFVIRGNEAGSPLAGSFVNGSAGEFEGSQPVKLVLGQVRFEGAIDLKGTLRRSDRTRGDRSESDVSIRLRGEGLLTAG